MKKIKDEIPELIIEDITDTAEDLIVEETVEKEIVNKKESADKASNKDAVKEAEPKEEISKKDDSTKEIISESTKDKAESSEKKAGQEETKEADKTETEEVKDAKEKKDDKVPEADEKPKGKVIIDMKNIIKRYFIGQPNELEVLHGIDLKVYEGEFVAIVGQSGSGKSTLMNVIGALDRPTEGVYTLDGVDMFKAKDKDLSAIRCKKIGFVFQTYNLVARTSALKNVELPMLYSNTPRSIRTKRAKELLSMVGMEERMKHSPDELSGGQKQRVAIARAMANDPALILADEPTGALDSNTGRLIMDIFHRLHKEQGKTIVLITHSPELAEECERILTLKDGMFIGERKGSGKCAIL